MKTLTRTGLLTFMVCGLIAVPLTWAAEAEQDAPAAATQGAAALIELRADLIAFESEVVLGEPVHLVVAVTNPHEKAVTLPQLYLGYETIRDPHAAGDEEVAREQIRRVDGEAVPNARLVEVESPGRQAMTSVQEARSMQSPLTLEAGGTHLYLITLDTGVQQLQEAMRAAEAEPDAAAVTYERDEAYLTSSTQPGEYKLYFTFDSAGVPDPDVKVVADTAEAKRPELVEVGGWTRVHFTTAPITITLTDPADENDDAGLGVHAE